MEDATRRPNGTTQRKGCMDIEIGYKDKAEWEDLLGGT